VRGDFKLACRHVALDGGGDGLSVDRVGNEGTSDWWGRGEGRGVGDGRFEGVCMSVASGKVSRTSGRGSYALASSVRV
jgi:hypothetical protein